MKIITPKRDEYASRYANLILPDANPLESYGAESYWNLFLRRGILLCPNYEAWRQVIVGVPGITKNTALLTRILNREHFDKTRKDIDAMKVGDKLKLHCHKCKGTQNATAKRDLLNVDRPLHAHCDKCDSIVGIGVPFTNGQKVATVTVPQATSGWSLYTTDGPWDGFASAPLVSTVDRAFHASVVTERREVQDRKNRYEYITRAGISGFGLDHPYEDTVTNTEEMATKMHGQRYQDIRTKISTYYDGLDVSTREAIRILRLVFEECGMQSLMSTKANYDEVAARLVIKSAATTLESIRSIIIRQNRAENRAENRSENNGAKGFDETLLPKVLNVENRIKSLDGKVANVINDQLKVANAAQLVTDLTDRVNEIVEGFNQRLQRDNDRIQSLSDLLDEVSQTVITNGNKLMMLPAATPAPETSTTIDRSKIESRFQQLLYAGLLGGVAYASVLSYFPEYAVPSFVSIAAGTGLYSLMHRHLAKLLKA